MDKLIQLPRSKNFLDVSTNGLYKGNFIRDQLLKNQIFEKLIIFKTCSVTEEANKVKKSIRQMKESKPSKNNCNWMCSTNFSTKMLEMPEVNFCCWE